jgi:hypothetical protein
VSPPWLNCLLRGKWQGFLHFTAFTLLTTLVGPPTRVWSNWHRVAPERGPGLQLAFVRRTRRSSSACSLSHPGRGCWRGGGGRRRRSAKASEDFSSRTFRACRNPASSKLKGRFAERRSSFFLSAAAGSSERGPTTLVRTTHRYVNGVVRTTLRLQTLNRSDRYSACTSVWAGA